MRDSVPLEKMILNANVNDVYAFVIGYARKHKEFRQAFTEKFNPQPVSTGDKEKYKDLVKAAFVNNPFTTGGRYRNWKDYGFDPVEVRADLEGLINKIDWFKKAGDFDEAILICQAMIEAIPDEWEPQFDYDGDVQVIYDGAIDKLQEMLEQRVLSEIQITRLFDWYRLESPGYKHRYIGMNTSLNVLENYFTATPKMFLQTIAGIENRIANATSDYEKESAVISKIRVLKDTGHDQKAEEAIIAYLEVEGVRRIRLQELIDAGKYGAAIHLLKEGIEVAVAKGHSRTVVQWKEDLLGIFILQKDTGSILSLSEELLITDSQRKHYDTLKKYTSQQNWPATIERILTKMNSRYSGFNLLKADILIEHQMWDRLMTLCKSGGAGKIEEYENYLKPFYAKEIFESYLQYVEREATIADPHSYTNVARILRKMKKFEGGKDVVNLLLNKYMTVYKRRPRMMQELKGV